MCPKDTMPLIWKKIQVKIKYFHIRLPGVMHLERKKKKERYFVKRTKYMSCSDYDKKGFCLLVSLVQKQVIKLLRSQKVAMWLICSLEFTPPHTHTL